MDEIAGFTTENMPETTMPSRTTSERWFSNQRSNIKHSLSAPDTRKIDSSNSDDSSIFSGLSMIPTSSTGHSERSNGSSSVDMDSEADGESTGEEHNEGPGIDANSGGSREEDIDRPVSLDGDSYTCISVIRSKSNEEEPSLLGYYPAINDKEPTQSSFDVDSLIECIHESAKKSHLKLVAEVTIFESNNEGRIAAMLEEHERQMNEDIAPLVKNAKETAQQSRGVDPIRSDNLIEAIEVCEEELYKTLSQGPTAAGEQILYQDMPGDEVEVPNDDHSPENSSQGPTEIGEERLYQDTASDEVEVPNNDHSPENPPHEPTEIGEERLYQDIAGHEVEVPTDDQSPEDSPQGPTEGRVLSLNQDNSDDEVEVPNVDHSSENSPEGLTEVSTERLHRAISGDELEVTNTDHSMEDSPQKNGSCEEDNITSHNEEDTCLCKEAKADTSTEDCEEAAVDAAEEGKEEVFEDEEAMDGEDMPFDEEISERGSSQEIEEENEEVHTADEESSEQDCVQNAEEGKPVEETLTETTSESVDDDDRDSDENSSDDENNVSVASEDKDIEESSNHEHSNSHQEQVEKLLAESNSEDLVTFEDINDASTVSHEDMTMKSETESGKVEEDLSAENESVTTNGSEQQFEDKSQEDDKILDDSKQVLSVRSVESEDGKTADATEVSGNSISLEEVNRLMEVKDAEIEEARWQAARYADLGREQVASLKRQLEEVSNQNHSTVNAKIEEAVASSTKILNEQKETEFQAQLSAIRNAYEAKIEKIKSESADKEMAAAKYATRSTTKTLTETIASLEKQLESERTAALQASWEQRNNFRDAINASKVAFDDLSKERNSILQLLQHTKEQISKRHAPVHDQITEIDMISGLEYFALDRDPESLSEIEKHMVNIFQCFALHMESRDIETEKLNQVKLRQESQIEELQKKNKEILQSTLLLEQSHSLEIDKMVRQLNDDGVTIILTTHYIEEAEEIADRVGIINRGQLLLVEDKVQLMQKKP